ncbi:hypothetical protein [Nocardioides endophyticus]|uniref:PaaD-like zinc ribbon domain-containing protein n=1 Tax=Nocardioides endophyticus TaxID=1353775 RepID=UPI003CD09391
MTRRTSDHQRHGTDPDLKDVACPHCPSTMVEVLSLVGSAASEVLFYCLECRSCFNWLKWQHELPALPRRDRLPRCL